MCIVFQIVDRGCANIEDFVVVGDERKNEWWRENVSRNLNWSDVHDHVTSISRERSESCPQLQPQAASLCHHYKQTRSDLSVHIRSATPIF